MDTKYLPSLKKIQIKNFSLYPGDLNFTYNFIPGINLIIGGNGVGKTTFLNILKFALIGLYKKGIDVKRREYRGIEYRYEKRVSLPHKYFSSRMDESVNYNHKAEVILTFRINKKTFEVTRNLNVPAITKVLIRENGKIIQLNGKIISQYEFDNLFADKEKNEIALSKTLQWQYEEAVGDASGHEFFDNLIFIVNDILFFNETRKTIMWDSSVQNKLSSKYFVDPRLDEKKEEAEREWKYQDSLARHKSEDIRAIRKIIESISDKDKKNKHFKDLINDVERSKKAVSVMYRELEKIQRERAAIEVRLNKIHSDKNHFSKRLEDLEVQKRNEEQIIFIDLYDKVTPKYYEYLQFLKVSGSCPLCNNHMSKFDFEKIKSNESNCMMCGNDIHNSHLTSSKLVDIKKQISIILENIRKKEKEIIVEDENLEKLDKKFRDSAINLNTSQSNLRKAEFAIQEYQASDESKKTDTEFKAMNARINELEREKEIAQSKSNNAFDEAATIIEKIDSQRLESREKLSGMFNQFGSKFLGAPCELVYEDPKDGGGKRYLPRIGGADRKHEEELSESQRFFIDQSFRMSLLNFFNSSTSFFMCETPDSSLDISYEKNAAKIFLEYVKQPNELILTSNLNNSEFLDYLIEQAPAINYINLLAIGKQSAIQINSKELLKASNKIERIINGKRN